MNFQKQLKKLIALNEAAQTASSREEAAQILKKYKKTTKKIDKFHLESEKSND
jgi:hypothetical protein